MISSRIVLSLVVVSLHSALSADNKTEQAQDRESFCRRNDVDHHECLEFFFFASFYHVIEQHKKSIYWVHRWRERQRDEEKKSSMRHSTKAVEHYLRQSRKKSSLVNESIKCGVRSVMRKIFEKRAEEKNERHSSWWLLIVCYLFCNFFFSPFPSLFSSICVSLLQQFAGPFSSSLSPSPACSHITNEKWNLYTCRVQRDAQVFSSVKKRFSICCSHVEREVQVPKNKIVRTRRRKVTPLTLTHTKAAAAHGWLIHRLKHWTISPIQIPFWRKQAFFSLFEQAESQQWWWWGREECVDSSKKEKNV